MSYIHHRYILAALLMSIMVIFQSCEKDDEPTSHIPADAVYDFVTIVESSSDGSKFEMQKSDDSPLIIYTSGYDLASSSTHVSVGDRVIICYKRVDGEIYTSGPITLYAYAKLSNTENKALIGTSDEYKAWASPAFDIQALWRSGEYINLQTYLYVYQAFSPKTFVLVADQTTLDDEIPVLHLIYENRDNNDGQNRYMEYASFNIGEIWSLETCRGVRIEYPTTSGTGAMIFEK